MGRSKRQRHSRTAAAPPKGQTEPDFADEFPGAKAMADPVWIVATLVFLIAVLATLTRNGLWNDEWIKQYEFGARPDDYPYSSRPGHPLHFFIGSLFARAFGADDYAFRLPWAFFAAGCIPLAYWLGALAGGRRLGRIAAVVAATSPYLLFYARDANYYAEMMFYAMGTAAGFWTFLISGSAIGLVLGFVCVGLSYLTHPFGVVGAGGLAMGAGAGILFPGGGREGALRLIRIRGVPPAVLGLKLGFVAVVVGGLAMSGLVPRVTRDGVQFLKQFQLGASYTNTALNANFVTQTLREFGPSIVLDSALIRLLAWLYPFAAVIGLVAIARKRPALALSMGFVFALTAFVLFCFKIDRFFHMRYVSYAQPFYIFAIAAGLWSLGQALERAKPRSAGAWAWPAGAFLLAAAPLWIATLIFDGAYLNAVEDHFEDRWTDDDRLFTYQMIWPVTPKTPAGIPPSQHVEMPGLVTIGQGSLNAAYFKYNLVDFPAGWLLHHWNEPRTFDGPLLEWADQWMTRAVDAPSAFNSSPIQWYNRPKPELAIPLVHAVLHRWDWPDRYVLAPRTLEINLADESDRPRLGLKRELGLLNRRIEADGASLSWSSPMLFEHTGNYLAEISLASPIGGAIDPGAFQIRFAKDGPGIALNAASLGDGRIGARFPLADSGGRHELSVEIHAPPGIDLAQLTPRLRVMPDFISGFEINPLFFHPPDPRGQTLFGPGPKEADILTFRRNDSATWRFRAPQSGRYRLRFNAIEDRPGPVVLDVVIDGVPEGILSFDAAKDQPGARDIVVKLDHGEHDLTVNFLSERDVNATAPELDNDLKLTGMMIALAGAGAADQRVELPSDLVRAGGAPAQGFSDFQAPNLLGQGWQSIGDGSLIVRADEPGGDPNDRWVGEDFKIIELVLARSSPGAQLTSPPIAITPGQMIYLDWEVSSPAEFGHSANVLLGFRSNAGEELERRWIGGADINLPTAWKRMAAMANAPDEAAYVQVMLFIIRNSRQIVPAESAFAFRRLRIIESLGR